MYECLICYHTDVAVDEMVYLECLHRLCKCCYNQLQKQSCPFCRTVIKKVVERKPQNIMETCSKNLEHTIRVRVRRRRRRNRTTTETIDSEAGRIIIETSVKDNRYRSKKPKQRRDNRKKGHWAKRNCHARCLR